MVTPILLFMFITYPNDSVTMVMPIPIIANVYCASKIPNLVISYYGYSIYYFHWLLYMYIVIISCRLLINHFLYI